MARRGFFAELNYQAQQAEKRQRQRQATAMRAQLAAEREHERAVKAAERAAAAAARASEVERKEAEKQARLAHIQAREAEVAEMNASLRSTYDEIDTLLEATLSVDDYVDLNSLRVTAQHPPFNPGSLGTPIPPVPPFRQLEPPAYVEPGAPTGLAAAFGGKKKHAERVAAAQAEHARRMQEWRGAVAHSRAEHQHAVEMRNQDESARVASLTRAQERYQLGCQEREAQAKAQNDELAKLINELAFDVPAAIEEYVGIVLSNSVYPDAFPVSSEHTFDLETRELTLAVRVPEAASLPSAKEYKYVKSKDEITSTQLSVKAQKERYASAVHETAVRTLHEIFEADRAGKVHSISLTVGVDHLAPATGLPQTVPLVQVAADRQTFMAFDLSQVVARATLEHLGAALSKSPFDLTPADLRRGVRQRGHQ